MTCCFMNLHQQKNAEDLKKHFDKEIHHAVDWGCSIFVTGTKYPEDAVFSERVKEISKFYAEDEIRLVQLQEPDDAKLKDMFLQIADWEIYSYEC